MTHFLDRFLDSRQISVQILDRIEIDLSNCLDSRQIPREISVQKMSHDLSRMCLDSRQIAKMYLESRQISENVSRIQTHFPKLSRNCLESRQKTLQNLDKKLSRICLEGFTVLKRQTRDICRKAQEIHKKAWECLGKLGKA